MTVASPIIVALDYPQPDQALAMADRLDPAKVRVKVGKELFTRGGPEVVRALHDKGFQVFLDLKFHDIPNTVAGAVKAAADLGVWMVNVHASGGSRMMLAAREALSGHDSAPLLIAVTVLTSQERADLVEIGIDHEPEDQVRRLAALTRDSGLDGVVCSAREAAMLRAAPGPRMGRGLHGDRAPHHPSGKSHSRGRRYLTKPFLIRARKVTAFAYSPAAPSRLE